ncbi:MAG: hypothetical protein SPK75_05690 [Victivallales bacterium]|nr:hypothetical protein [bacterium]MDY5695850.1 hypothetical protein [Victivallales bacterium]
MKTARRTVLFFLTGLAPLLSSCALFEEEKTPELQPEELIRIAAQKRFQNLQRTRILHVAVCAPKGNTSALEEAARRNGWRIAYFPIGGDSAFAAVRNGQADLAVGKLTPAEIRAARLTPLMEYQDSGKTCAFAAWNDAEELKNALESGTNPTNSNIPLEKSVLQE